MLSESQRRGLLYLLPLVLIILLLTTFMQRVKQPALQEFVAEKQDSVVLSKFNPNIDDYEQLREAGVPVEVAVGIVRWRKYGKVYRIVEDLALVQGMNDSLYAVLKSYAVIDEQYQPRHRYNNDFSADREWDTVAHKRARRERDTVALQPFMIDTASARYLYLLGFSRRQSEVIARYVKMLGGLCDEQELRDCYVISDSMANRILPYVIFTKKREPVEDWHIELPVEINSADTTLLKRVNGIGSKSASEIVIYRELLGGYHSVEQLRELKCVTQENYERFFSQICCDSCKISKIDINFVPSEELRRHPYISLRTLKRIIKQRQLKGGWSRIEEMVEQNILTEEEAKRLAPYLRFRLRATE